MRLFRILTLLLPLVFMTACEAVDTPGLASSSSPKRTDVVYIVPPGEARQQSMTSLLLHPEQTENGEIKVIRQYVAASGSTCILMGTDLQSAAAQWLACQNGGGTWIVKPALLNADAVFGIVR